MSDNAGVDRRLHPIQPVLYVNLELVKPILKPSGDGIDGYGQPRLYARKAFAITNHLGADPSGDRDVDSHCGSEYHLGNAKESSIPRRVV